MRAARIYSGARFPKLIAIARHWRKIRYRFWDGQDVGISTPLGAALRALTTASMLATDSAKIQKRNAREIDDEYSARFCIRHCRSQAPIQTGYYYCPLPIGWKRSGAFYDSQRQQQQERWWGAPRFLPGATPGERGMGVLQCALWC